MAADNKLELVIRVDAAGANASIKSVNASLSSLESTAVSAARGAAQGVDGLTGSVAKGAAAGTLLAHAFEKVVEWVKEYPLEAAKLAARNETLAVNQQLARANSYNGDAIERLVERIKALGITTQASRGSGVPIGPMSNQIRSVPLLTKIKMSPATFPWAAPTRPRWSELFTNQKRERAYWPGMPGGLDQPSAWKN